MNALPVSRACDLTAQTDATQWLIDPLWAEQAVGILGGEPKCCKSFLALDIAVSVASGTPCLRQFPVRRNGPVLLYPAEDSLGVVRQRLEGICSAAGAALDALPLYVITAPRVLLDLPQDRERLRRCVPGVQRGSESAVICRLIGEAPVADMRLRGAPSTRLLFGRMRYVYAIIEYLGILPHLLGIDRTMP